MKQCTAWLPEAIGIAGVALGTAIAIQGWPSVPWKLIDGQTWATWAGVAATTAAVATALWIAGKESREKARENRDRAAVFAAYLAPKLDQYVNSLRAISYVVDAVGPQRPESAFIRFREDLLSIENSILMEHILQLAPIERRVAHNLAHGLALVEELRNRSMKVPDWDACKFSTAQDFAKRLWRITDKIAAAQRICVVAAGEYVYAPTLEDIYGPEQEFLN